MICDILTSKQNQIVFRPTYNSPIDAYDMNKMLEDCFPYNNYTFDRGLWDFYLACFDGYDNAIIFNS